MPPRGREIILGIGGGISAYKSADLLRRLQDHGYLVTVIPTRSSQNFVGSATWAALSGRPVHDDLWADVHNVPHIALARVADAIVIAPTTADLLSRIATGRADDLLTNVILASQAPLILVPAMHPEMWSNPATQENVRVLRNRGVTVVEPDEGRMTGSDVGVGRYPESAKIIEQIQSILVSKSDLKGVSVLVTAGGTREPIDPVRYIGNNSSGKQGFAVAFAAAMRGARVTLICAHCTEPDLEGVEMVRVNTADEMHIAVQKYFYACQVLVMTAAVADAKPLQIGDQKLEKSSYTQIALTPTVDILKEVGGQKGERVLVGFAAQTGSDGREKALAKYAAKNLDLLYVNDVTGGAIFGAENTSGAIIADGVVKEEVNGISKLTLAHKLLDFASHKLGLSHD